MTDFPVEFTLEVAIHRLEHFSSPIADPSVSFKYVAFPEQTIYPTALANSNHNNNNNNNRNSRPASAAASPSSRSGGLSSTAGRSGGSHLHPSPKKATSNSSSSSTPPTSFFDTDRNTHVQIFASGKRATIFLTQREVQLNSLLQVNVQSRRVTVASILVPLVKFSAGALCSTPGFEPGRQGYSFDNGTGLICGDFVLRSMALPSSSSSHFQQAAATVPPLSPSRLGEPSSRAQSRMESGLGTTAGDLPMLAPSTSFSVMGENERQASCSAAAAAAAAASPASVSHQEAPSAAPVGNPAQPVSSSGSQPPSSRRDSNSTPAVQAPPAAAAAAAGDAAGEQQSAVASAPAAAPLPCYAAPAPAPKFSATVTTQTNVTGNPGVTAASKKADAAHAAGTGDPNQPLVVKVQLPPAAAKKYFQAKEEDERRRKALPPEPECHAAVLKLLVSLKEILDVASYVLSDPAVTIAPESKLSAETTQNLRSAVQVVNQQISVLLSCEVAAVLGHGVDDPILCRMQYSSASSTLPADATPPNLPARPGPGTVGRFLYDQVLGPIRSLFVICVGYGRLLTREGVKRAMVIVDKATIDFDPLVKAINSTLEQALAPPTARVGAAGAPAPAAKAEAEQEYKDDFSSSVSSSSSSSGLSSSSSSSSDNGEPVKLEELAAKAAAPAPAAATAPSAPAPAPVASQQAPAPTPVAAASVTSVPVQQPQQQPAPTVAQPQQQPLAAPAQVIAPTHIPLATSTLAPPPPQPHQKTQPQMAPVDQAPPVAGARPLPESAARIAAAAFAP